MNLMLIKKLQWKQKVIPVAILLFGTILAFIFLGTGLIHSQNQTTSDQSQEAKKIDVGVQTVANSQKIFQIKEFPATVTGDQEITIAAKTSGVVTWTSLALGQKVGANQVIAVIDDTGNNLKYGSFVHKSIQVQQAELAVKQAEESYSLAKKNDKELKTDASHAAKDIAELQLKSARLTLKSILDSHEINAPVAGTVIEKMVNTGDAVAIGQPLAVLTSTNKIKIKFFVDESELKTISLNQSVQIVDNEEKILAGKITNISPQADASTRRFPVEIMPSYNSDLRLGTIVSVIYESSTKPAKTGNLLIPLSAVTVGQNENYIFIIQDGKAQKKLVTVEKITSETAEIQALDLTPETQIVISGNKLLSDGTSVNIKP
jgi:RND family efflux transporter MFP subunit